MLKEMQPIIMEMEKTTNKHLEMLFIIGMGQMNHPMREFIPNDLRKQTIRDMSCIRRVLKKRGIRVSTQRGAMGLGLEIHFDKVDLKAKAPLSMNIPSPLEIINGPSASDLPKHGYLGS